MTGWNRRTFLAATAAVASPFVKTESAAPQGRSGSAPLKIGLVTYNLAKDWDLATVIKNCADTRYDGVELRTGHAHGVELGLSASVRADVRKRFADSPVKLVQLGSTYEFHAVDQAEVRKNIEGCRQYIQLAHDVGSPGVKVRPNGLQTKAGIPVEKTLEQIGKSLAEVGKTAADHDVEVRVEIHGNGTSRVEYIERIMAVANHPKVVVNWNSNPTDLEGGTLEENFARVSKKVRHVHMRDLFDAYPWRTLLGLLSRDRFQGYCCAEVPESPDPLRVMRYFRALFLAYQGL
jgi:sugar phosphate isomerase/epimerase